MRRAFAFLAALWLVLAPAAALATPAAWGGIYGGGGIAAFPNIGTASGINPSACGTSRQITTGTNVPQGALIVFWTADSASGSHTASDTVGNTYQVQTGASDANGFRVRLFYSVNSTALPSGDHITLTGNGGAIGTCYIAASAFSGITTTTPFDNTTNNQGSSTSPSLSSGTLSDPFELVVAATFINAGGPDAFTQAAGFTTDSSVGDTSNTNAFRTAYKIVSTNASVTYAPTLGTSRVWNALLGTFIGVQ